MPVTDEGPNRMKGTFLRDFAFVLLQRPLHVSTERKKTRIICEISTQMNIRAWEFVLLDAT